MSAFGPIPTPPSLGYQFNAVCDLYANVEGKGYGHTGENTWPTVTHAEVPCSIQEMSSSAQFRYGTLGESTLYDLYIPLSLPDGTSIKIIGTKSAWQFESDGVRYQNVGAGVDQLDGVQKIAAIRIGVA